MIDGFVHHFFFGFRYFVTPGELLAFVHHLVGYSRVRGVCSEAVRNCLARRAALLIAVWIDGYYSVDFKADHELANALQMFLRNEV